MKKLIIIILLLFSSVCIFGQTTIVTATITDSDSVVWTAAQVSVSFQPNPNVPNLASYNIAGMPIISSAGPNYAQYLQQKVVTDGSGALTVTLLDNQLISPAGSSWKFVIRPNANVQAISYNPIAVTGGSFSLTTYLSTNSIAPRLPALPGAYAYADVEIQPIPQTGGSYFNNSSLIQRIWNGTAWQNGASGGGANTPNTNLPICGNNATNLTRACIPSTDYIAPGATVGGALSGTLPNPTIIGTTISPKIINGVSFSPLYSGALAERLNACLIDAINLTNGNTSNTCDATGEVAGRVNLDVPVTIGDSNGDKVILKIPCGATWVGTISNGIDVIIYQYGGSTITGSCFGTSSNLNITTSSSSNPAYIFSANSTINSPYISDQGFNIINIGGGHATASGVGMLLNGFFADGTTLFGVNVNDSLDTYAVEASGLCCGATWQNSSINGGGGSIPLFLRTDSSGFGRPNQAFEYINGSIVNPGVGKPAVFCQDTSSNPKYSVDSFINVYTETNPSDATGTAYYKVDGCAKVSFNHITFASNSVNNTEPGISFTTRGHTSLIADDLVFISSTGTFTYPSTAIVPPSGPLQMTDSNGSYAGHYSNSTAWESDANGNTYFGQNSASSLSTGTINTFYGFNAGNAVTSGLQNSFFGWDAGILCTTCGANAAFGQGAGEALTTGTQNSFFGAGAGHICTTCTASGAFGQNALVSDTASAAYQFGSGINSTNNSMQFFNLNFLLDNGDLPSVHSISQVAANNWAGTCTMTTTTCTVTLTHTFTIPICIATLQGTSATVIAAECNVSGITATVTAASSNTGIWAVAVFGNPN